MPASMFAVQRLEMQHGKFTFRRVFAKQTARQWTKHGGGHASLFADRHAMVLVRGRGLAVQRGRRGVCRTGKSTKGVQLTPFPRHVVIRQQQWLVFFFFFFVFGGQWGEVVDGS